MLCFDALDGCYTVIKFEVSFTSLNCMSVCYVVNGENESVNQKPHLLGDYSRLNIVRPKSNRKYFLTSCCFVGLS